MSRIEELRLYLFDLLNILTEDRSYQINADFLGEVGDFSLDKIPTQSIVKRWIDGSEVKRDVYAFRSRKEYSQDVINNLNNIGFFERFEDLIRYNNRHGILPNIDGILSVECLNSGSLNRADTKTAIFNIQIQITYLVEVNNEGYSI